MIDLGSKMAATSILKENIDNPVQLLRKEITTMRSELNWYQNKYPTADIKRKAERISRLSIICDSLEACEPVFIMQIIHSKLTEAKKHKFQPHVACVWLPLVPNVPDILYARPVIIDLVGWDITTPYDYDCVGMGNAGGFICSNTDEGGQVL